MSKYFDTQNLSFMAPEVKENGRHMVMTNVHKDVKTKYVNIDTRFQEEYNDAKYAECKCKLPQTISNVQSIKATNLELPVSFYNFSLQKKNTYFAIENLSNSTLEVVLIDDGNYSDLSTLVSELNNEINTAGVSVTLSATAQKIEFDCTGSTAGLKFHFNVDEKGQTDKNNLKSKLGWMLGFREPTYQVVAGGSLMSESFVNLHSHRYIYLSIDEFSQTKPNSFITPSFNYDMNSNVLARISLDPNTYAFGSVLCASNSGGKLLSDRRTYGGKTDIQKLHIQLLDETGNLVDLNRMDFSFTLEIEYL
jgi:hypothetical protein